MKIRNKLLEEILKILLEDNFLSLKFHFFAKFNAVQMAAPSWAGFSRPGFSLAAIHCIELTKKMEFQRKKNLAWLALMARNYHPLYQIFVNDISFNFIYRLFCNVFEGVLLVLVQ